MPTAIRAGGKMWNKDDKEEDFKAWNARSGGSFCNCDLKKVAHSFANSSVL